MLLALSTQTTSDENALKDFLSQHPSIKAEEILIADMYDDAGNFKELNLSIPNKPVTLAYMTWYINKAKKSILDGKGISFEELIASMNQKREALNKK
ncbi:MAG: hypothetical protein SFY32_10435 [Bacteroidota bacterium]|nr:hypothetical protein [Bacteroidota bacterium]